MITKFKIFESLNKPKYSIGDYIKIKDNSWVSYMGLSDSIEYLNLPLQAGYIIGVDNICYIFKSFKNSTEEIKRYVIEDRIERLLTPDEIEEYKIIEYSNKYNL